MSEYDISLSYSARKLYLGCPKQYHYKYILRDPAKGDPKDTMFGSIIGKIFEWFYDRRLYGNSDPVSSCVNLIKDATLEVFGAEGYIKGTNYDYEEKLRINLQKFVPLGIDTIRNNRLLSNNNKAELDLTTVYQGDSSLRMRMVGRADFVYYHSPTDFWILDGKASKHREKYVDSQQLIWYAVLHYLKYGVAPKRIGFIFWMFPDNPISWVQYSSDDMRNLIKDTQDVAGNILSGRFAAKPSGECHRCVYKNKCEDGVKYLAQRRKETSTTVSDAVFDIEVL
jgi:hypothetical protein